MPKFSARITKEDQRGMSPTQAIRDVTLAPGVFLFRVKHPNMFDNPEYYDTAGDLQEIIITVYGDGLPRNKWPDAIVVAQSYFDGRETIEEVFPYTLRFVDEDDGNLLAKAVVITEDV